LLELFLIQPSCQEERELAIVKETEAYEKGLYSRRENERGLKLAEMTRVKLGIVFAGIRFAEN